MAITQNPYWTVNVSFQDRDMNKGSVQLYVAASVLVADLISSLGSTIIPAIQALSDATVTGWSISRTAQENAPSLAAETSDVERKGVFTFRGANNRPVTMQVPSIKNTLVVDRTNQINTADPVVTAFTEMVTNGTILGLTRPVTVTGSDVTVFVNAEKRHRGSARG
jgi:phospholipase/lecithinase/hemolysin